MGIACAPTGTETELLESSAEVLGTGNDIDIENTARLIDSGWFHNCGITTKGKVKCWGRDNYGQVSKADPSPLTEIGTGAYHSCGLTASKSAVCWGRNQHKQTDAPTTQFEQLSTGTYHNCGLTKEGSIECWGWDAYKQSTPPAGTGYAQISTGRFNSCALKTNGKATCWGYSGYGHTTSPSTTAFRQLSQGALHTCGLTEAGTIECWGYTGWGLSNPPTGQDFVEIQSGAYHSCARHTDGTVECWGANWQGQANPPPNKSFVQISTGYTVSCGLEKSGTVECWGSNSHGQQVAPTNLTFAVPVQGDVCADAIEIEVSDGQQIISGDTSNALNMYQPSCTYSYAPDQVYAFTIEQPTQLEAVVSGYDTVLYLRSTCEDAGTNIACNDDSNPPGGFGSRLEEDLQPGTYFLFVDGYASSKGLYSLSVTFTPSDVDECALETDNCDVNATCANTIGSFTCACNNGYEGDGDPCTDIDEYTRAADN